MLVVEARYYADINAMLLAGAVAAARAGRRRASSTIVVPGALEIPTAVALAGRSGRFDAYVALGCVIRGETSHYDLVADESCRGLTDLGVREGLPIGNGILTVENERQAEVRADPNGQDKGGGAALAALHLLALKRRLDGEIPMAARAKPTLNRRRAARLAAVQALYQVEVTGRAAGEGRGRVHRAPPRQPARAVRSRDPLARGRPRVVPDGRGGRLGRPRADRPEIERCLAAGLDAGPLRLPPRATLRAGAYELAERTDVPVKVVINEYVELAAPLLHRHGAGLRQRGAGQAGAAAAGGGDGAVGRRGTHLSCR